MRRIPVTALLVVSLLGITPASRADVPAPSSETTVYLWDDALPDGVTTVQAACDDQLRVVGTPTPLDVGFTVPNIPSYRAPWPHHRFAWELHPANGAIAGFEIVRPSALDLITAGATVYTFGTAGGFRVELDVAASDGAWQLSARGYIRSGTPLTDYHAYDTRGRVYTWTAGTESGSGTLDEFVAQHGDGPTTAHLWVGGCPAQPGGYGGAAVVDGLRLGDQVVTTYDAEMSTIRLGGGGSSGRPGHVGRWIYCTLTDNGPFSGVVGQRLVFESRPHGGGPFSRIGTATTAAGGSASLKIRPRTSIDYRCAYAGNDGANGANGAAYPPAQSGIFTVPVDTHLTIRAHRSPNGKRVIVTGTADPRNPGTSVALRVRRLNWDFGRSRVIDRGRITRHGTYRLAAPLSRGTWEVFVAVGRAPANAPGTSVRRYVK